MSNNSNIRYAEVRFSDGGKNECFYWPNEAYFQKNANAFVVTEDTKDGPVTHIYPREIVKTFVVKHMENT